MPSPEATKLAGGHYWGEQKRMQALSYKESYKRRLPHIQPPGATLFITFRLANSLPAAVMRKFLHEQRRVNVLLSKIEDFRERKGKEDEEQRHLFAKWDRALDAATEGPTWLGDDRIAAVVADCIHSQDGKEFGLVAFCIMPNHVHLVCTPRENDKHEYRSLAAVMHLVKGSSANRANALLSRSGEFWQHESYDHVVRDDNELARIIEYILNNPLKANLVSDRRLWKWSYSMFGM